MAEALRWCWDHSQPEDRIVLSPACSSHDQFCNFRQRGEEFAALVSALAWLDVMVRGTRIMIESCSLATAARCVK